jgi:hypothetical protein
LTKSKKVDSKNSFKSDAGIKSTMLELLQWECLEKSINEKMSAAGGKNLTQKEMEHKNLTLEEKQKQKAALDLRKLRMINNYIFPSMANLVVFFEYAATKELRDSFSAVIQQLLFGRDKKS